MNKRRCFLTFLFLCPLLLFAEKAEEPGWSLENCIEYGLAHNTNLRQQALQYRQRVLDLQIEEAYFDPTLRAGYEQETESQMDDYSAGLSQKGPWGFSFSADFGARDTGPDQALAGDYSLRLSKEILGGGSWAGHLRGQKSAALQLAKAGNQLRLETRRFFYQVKRLYYRLIQERQTLHIQELNLQRARKNLEHALVREQPLDIARAELEVPGRENQAVAARRRIRTSMDELKVLLGMDPLATLTLRQDFQFSTAGISLQEDMNWALANHEELLNEGLEWKRLEADRDYYGKRLWPSLSAFAGTSRGSQRYFDYHADDQNTVGIELEWQLGRRADRARHEKAELALENQQEGWEEAKREKAREIRSLAWQLEETERSIALQAERVRVGERLVELYRDRYENGEIDILEYIRSENDLEGSRVDLVRQKTTYMELLAAYRFAVGRGEKSLAKE